MASGNSERKGIPNENLINSIVKLKEENEKLEELANFLRMENFDYALKCNHLENIISDIHSINKNIPSKLIETTQNICTVLQVCGSYKENEKETDKIENLKTNETCQKSVESEKIRTCNKAHIVKPHMVNGHVLYVPTINLTRVTDSQFPSNDINSTSDQINRSKLNTLATNSHENCDPTQSASSNNETQETSELRNNQLSHREELEPSTSTSTAKSPSHSTVLSGTFQEVKIYLNQMSQESLNEDSRQLIQSPHEAKHSHSTQKNRRSNTSSSTITKRRKKRE